MSAAVSPLPGPSAPERAAWRDYLPIAFKSMCRLNSAVKTREFRHLRGEVYGLKTSFADLAERAGCLAAAELEPGGLTRLTFNVDGRAFSFHTRKARPRAIGAPLARERPGPEGTPHYYTAEQRRARVDSWLADVKYVLSAAQAAEKGQPEPPAPVSCPWIDPNDPEALAAAAEAKAAARAERLRVRALRPGGVAVFHRLRADEEPGVCAACAGEVRPTPDYHGKPRVVDYHGRRLCLRCALERDPSALARFSPALTLRPPFSHRNFVIRPRWESEPV